MRISTTISCACGLVITGAACGQDSGPGPVNGEASRQYSVMVVRAAAVDQGTFVFERGTDGQTPTGTNNGTNGGGATTTPNSSAGNDTTGATANPSANGDNVTVGAADPSAGIAGEIAGSPNTNTGTATPNTNTTGSTGTNTGTASNGTTSNGTTTVGTTSDPPSYWTRARVNGQVATRTSNSSSSDYWTTARANGQVPDGSSTGSAGTGGNGNVAGSSAFSSGMFTDMSAEEMVGTWYAIDFGNFSLWYASGTSANGNVTYTGYATPEMIAGRTLVGNGGFFESLFTGSFFVGQFVDGSPTDETME